MPRSTGPLRSRSVPNHWRIRASVAGFSECRMQSASLLHGVYDGFYRLWYGMGHMGRLGSPRLSGTFSTVMGLV